MSCQEKVLFMQNINQPDFVFRIEVAQGQLRAILGMMEKEESLEKILHQICAVQAALEKIKVMIQNQLLKENIEAIRAIPNGEIDERKVNKLLSLYTNFSGRG